MKKIVKVFIGISIVFVIFTAWQLTNHMTFQTKPVMMKVEKASTRVDKSRPLPPPPTAADLQRMRAEEAAANAELRKEKREDIKMYLGFAGTIISTLTTIILAIINRKKD